MKWLGRDISVKMNRAVQPNRTSCKAITSSNFRFGEVGGCVVWLVVMQVVVLVNSVSCDNLL
jgi:hypothetical protein